jgi:hypothetical protein
MEYQKNIFTNFAEIWPGYVEYRLTKKTPGYRQNRSRSLLLDMVRVVAASPYNREPAIRAAHAYEGRLSGSLTISGNENDATARQLCYFGKLITRFKNLVKNNIESIKNENCQMFLLHLHVVQYGYTIHY